MVQESILSSTRDFKMNSLPIWADRPWNGTAYRNGIVIEGRVF